MGHPRCRSIVSSRSGGRVGHPALSTEAERAEQLRDLLVPYSADEMQRFLVSSLVNSPQNDVAECSRAIAVSMVRRLL